MKRDAFALKALVFALLAASVWSEPAVASPARLLPADTLAVLSVPDWQKASARIDETAMRRLWDDPAMKPFKEELMGRLRTELILPLERELGVKLSDYAGLIHGQATLAFLRNGWDGGSGKQPAPLLLIDTGKNADQARKQLAALRQKWTDSGKQLRSDTVRGVEFTTLIVKRGDVTSVLDKAFPSSEPRESDTEESADKFEVILGQSESLLVVGNSLVQIEQVLTRQAGGAAPNLFDQAAFERSHAMLFRDAFAFGWVDFKSIYSVLQKQATAASAQAEGTSAPMPDKLLGALGLGGLNTVAFKAAGNAEGTTLELFLEVPESARNGLFKVFAMEKKEAAPPPFVPADVVKFSRFRIDGQKAWAAIESMIASISPELAGLVKMGMATIGKDKDPDFDLKKSLIGNVGDDFISFEKSPRASTLTEFATPPSLLLVGSPNPEKLAQALSAATALMPAPPGETSVRERDFLGRKIYTLPLPPTPAPDGGPAVKRSFTFAASGGYLAVSADSAMVEEFLRGTGSGGKALRETGPLHEAAQKVGGMDTGFFGYENQRESMRATFQLLRENADALKKLGAMRRAAGVLGDDEEEGGIEPGTWVDFKLLPPFDAVSKYFHFIVYNGSLNANGFSWKLFAPTPPQLR